MKPIQSSKSICIISTVHKADDVRIFYKEAVSLKEAGFEVFFIVPHQKAETIHGIQVINLPKSKNRLERVTKILWLAYRKAININAALYHLHDPELIVLGLVLRLRGKKIIYDMHENLPKQILNKHWIKPYIRLFLSYLIKTTERLTLNDIPIIFAEKSYNRDYCWHKNNVTILNLPKYEDVSESLNSYSNHNPFTIGYQGGVSAGRGSITTLEALKILNESGIVTQYECIGPMNECHKMELIKYCEINNLHNVNFYGYLPPNDGWQIIKKCNVGMAILHPIPNYIDSYPTKMFEYMAIGLPIIVSDFPLYREIIEKTRCGICVDPLNPVSIAEGLHWIYRHPFEAEEMGKQGRRAVQQIYNWKSENIKLIEFYKKILY